MVQAASCSATITHVIKPYESLVSNQHCKYKAIIKEIENSEEEQEKANKINGLLGLIEKNDIKQKEGKFS